MIKLVGIINLEMRRLYNQDGVAIRPKSKSGHFPPIFS
ncbi:hypothetical protein appser11_17520 [Actinobacillus pleuropneumoniae serovar 11 str. 56153]|uniref:Uncharacterized protein n=1 Tax=Actinobacillus pleuropneumoniae serovar 6 str. Femo TaxID=754256 RepID=A0A828PGU4_ACTPL|nr:hypothetical protein appser6_17660 [Actinobacillus pleuropneumoniae serovar 6 str. Femo]EFM93544.1 hypothetical protein appser9_17400 [Actinobacillus pleuropneumoniae serovar 9 str. CVJ13261]EFM97868.1 hypothetical protein appser11_17520 [Actinobacillus pleuropneumoniae serovar 11 str. 56153]EFN02110.1 hypothetical protein appser13_16850 [Actinobacillus pleuropneumoniae serovar 13 str. N273]